MGTVTQYNLQNVRDALGGPTPIPMSNYYRGGLYVPTTGTTTTREPSSGEYYDFSANGYYWLVDTNSQTGNVLWAGTNINFSPYTITSFTSGGFTYFRGTFRSQGKNTQDYGIFRTSTTTVSINTGVPSPGSSISISQLFGARNP